MFNSKNLSSAKSIFATAASVATTIMLIRTFTREFMPSEVENIFFLGVRKLTNRLSGNQHRFTMVIEEFNSLLSNQIYETAVTYLSYKVSPSIRRVKVSKPANENNFTVTIDQEEDIMDDFDGVQFKWRLICRKEEDDSDADDDSPPRSTETRSLELNFHVKHKEKVLKSYFPYILEQSQAIKQENKTLRIFKSISSSNYYVAPCWEGTKLDHPATFATLAMDSELKKAIMEDLDRFVERKDFYRKVGKAWKRGYLLYGPPGTGKSSLIAAMANYLNFDVYDLELDVVKSNSELSRILLGMANRSILIVEDIDCTVLEFKERIVTDEDDQDLSQNRRMKNAQMKSKVTLSGMLNVMDGLWSTVGDERIIVFTTNHRDKLDPALLRPGRMDMHIHMSYCTPSGFKVLASSEDVQLDNDIHSLLEEVLRLVVEVQVTPAQVAEEIMRSNDPVMALKGLIDFLKVKLTDMDQTAELQTRDKESGTSQDGLKEHFQQAS